MDNKTNLYDQVQDKVQDKVQDLKGTIKEKKDEIVHKVTDAVNGTKPNNGAGNPTDRKPYGTQDNWKQETPHDKQEEWNQNKPYGKDDYEKKPYDTAEPYGKPQGSQHFNKPTDK